MKKKTTKGMTLVEVLVAITVFTIIVGTIFTSIFGMRRVVVRQEAYFQFDTICRDIAHYGNKYGKAWDMEYFNLDESKELNVVYYNARFFVTEDATAEYRLEYRYDGDGALVISVYNNETGRVIIDELNYGRVENEG